MKLVLLDKDGVINEDSPAFIKSVAEVRFVPGSLEAIARLSQAGWRVVICSNQSGLGRRLFSYEAFGHIIAHLHQSLAEMGGRLDAVCFAPEAPEHATTMRKPAPGMLKDVARRLGLPLHGVWMIGDSATDLAAAHTAGAIPVLVLTGNGPKHQEAARTNGVAVYNNLCDAAKALMECHP